MKPDDSLNGGYLAHARLPSNSGRKALLLRLREISEVDRGSLLLEVSAKGEMFERGKSRMHDLVTDFEWAFPQLVVSSKALVEFHALIRHSLEQKYLEPFAVSLGVGECVLDIELGPRPDTSIQRDKPAVTIVCGVAASRVECSFSVDPSCVLELAEGLAQMSALIP